MKIKPESIQLKHLAQCLARPRQFVITVIIIMMMMMILNGAHVCPLDLPLTWGHLRTRLRRGTRVSGDGHPGGRGERGLVFLGSLEVGPQAAPRGQGPRRKELGPEELTARRPGPSSPATLQLPSPGKDLSREARAAP